ncbi:MAG: hypothetical protein R2776_04585 [Flavobacteriaceae bacterium]
MKKEIENLFIENNWSILEGIKDEPLEGKIEHYDVAGLTFTESFEVNLLILEQENLVVQKVFKLDGTLYGNLRMYASDPFELCKEVIGLSNQLRPDNYSQFAKIIYPKCTKLIFNDNGIWMKINLNK